MNTKTRKQKKNQTEGPRPSRPAPTSPLLRRRLLLVLLAVGVAAATWLFLEFVIWNTMPSELIGKWEVVDGPRKGSTFEFYRSGTMVGHVNAGGMLRMMNATVRVDGKNIFSTTQHPETGKYDTTVLVIQSLSEQELVVEDAEGKLLKMKRAK